MYINIMYMQSNVHKHNVHATYGDDTTNLDLKINKNTQTLIRTKLLE